jgi:hypothetical protein
MSAEKIFWAEAWDAKNIRSTLRIYNDTNNISNTVHTIWSTKNWLSTYPTGRQGINVEILLIEL